MPLSLKCKLSKLRHNGQITDDEYNELIKKLDGHDRQIKSDVINSIKQELNEIYPSNYTDAPIETSGILLRFKEVFELLERVENDK